jgi:hypothetical protein
MSEEEFAEWRVMFRAEELHPAADRLRHAQLRASLSNGPMTRSSKKPYVATEFFADPWAPPKAERPKLTASQIASQVAAANSIRRKRGGK